MNHRPNKLLGQHFLKPQCSWVTDALVAAADLQPDDTVLEIGPGRGALTRVLAKHAGRVIAVEKDSELAEELQKENIRNVEVIQGDILKVLNEIKEKKYKVVANIPYYLTARLIRLLLEQHPQPACIVLTIQKEVAQRIVATPPHMSLLALAVQVYGTPKIIKNVGPECFSPPPNVDSSILQIIPRQTSFFDQNKIDHEKFFAVARRAFQQKRKKLSTSLGIKFPNITEKRPEALSLEEWMRLISLMGQES